MNKPLTRKRRTREHVIADLSVNHVERQVLLCGHTVERVRADYGYDLLLTTYDANGEAESGEIHLQLKATDKLVTLNDGETISWKVQLSDLAKWLDDALPMILIVYDAPADKAYWLYVQRYFQRQPGFNIFAAGKSVNVHVSKQDVLDSAAVGLLARFRDLVSLQFLGKVDHDA